MPDELFGNPRLAALYDSLNPDRGDLEVYAHLAAELGVHDVLDLGCGTGTFAILLAARGFTVIGIDPARASLQIASRKSGADRVRWIHGDASDVTGVQVDLATMTGNVAQAIADQDDWHSTLRALHDAVRPGGYLVFETRDPADRGWEHWTRDETYRCIDPGTGPVRSWTVLTAVRWPLVSFRGTVELVGDGSVLTSDSTLRFRERDEVTADLGAAGFAVEEVRDAPDRPGREFVFIARRSGRTERRDRVIPAV